MDNPDNEIDGIKRRRKKSVAPVVVSVVGLLLCIVFGGFWLYGLNNPDSIQLPLASTTEQQAVRAYLKENLNDPVFEEVKWWPAKSTISHPEGEPAERVRLIRLKFRSKNPFGSKVIDTTDFKIVNGKAVTVFDGMYDISTKDH